MSRACSNGVAVWEIDVGVVVIVGTAKGAALLRSDDKRGSWEIDALEFKGWIVTAATRDSGGRYYVGVTSDVYGTAILASDDGSSWQQLESAPRYEPTDAGNEGHNRIIGAMDPMGHFMGSNRHVDQIWRLHAVGDVVYAGVSEAGLFRSDDRGKAWEPVRGLNEHPTRPSWGAGFGGLCAHSILVDERNPERLWVGISAAGVFRSDDGGETWAEKNDSVVESEGFCVHSLAHDPLAADLIYRQDHRGMYRSRDAGDSWQRIADWRALGRVELCIWLRRRAGSHEQLGLRPPSGRRQLPLPARRKARGVPEPGWRRYVEGALLRPP